MIKRIASTFARLGEKFPTDDLLYFGGLAMLGYGLHLWVPWVAFSACGALLMGTGYLMTGGRGK